MFATPVFAQSQDPHSGFRVEAIIGYDRTQVERDDAGGILFGVGAGYDFRVGGAVLGIEAEASGSTVDRCFDDPLRTRIFHCVNLGRDLYLGARAGAMVGGNVLLYAKAGYANGRFSLELTIPPSLPTMTPLTVRDNLDGVRAGAGAELGIGANSYVKIEYRYSHYSFGYAVGDHSFDRHQIVTGFGFRF